MKKLKTYFQKYNEKGSRAGREAVNASHPVLKELIAIINEQQNQYYTEKKEVDLFKYNTIWIPDELFDRILPKYYGLIRGKSSIAKEITFYIGSRPWRIFFKLEQDRENDIKEIEQARREEAERLKNQRIKEIKRREEMQKLKEDESKSKDNNSMGD